MAHVARIYTEPLHYLDGRTEVLSSALLGSLFSVAGIDDDRLVIVANQPGVVRHRHRVMAGIRPIEMLLRDAVPVGVTKCIDFPSVGVSVHRLAPVSCVLA